MEDKITRLFDVMSRDGDIERYWIYATEDEVRDAMKFVLGSRPLRFSVYNPFTGCRQTHVFENDDEDVIFDAVPLSCYPRVTKTYVIRRQTSVITQHVGVIDGLIPETILCYYKD